MSNEKLNLRAANALVRWRKYWENKMKNTPFVFCDDDRRLWKLAGQLMKARGIERKLP